jgi:alkylation response protein AidB-like acyl-CoA dehydrogenase
VGNGPARTPALDAAETRALLEAVDRLMARHLPPAEVRRRDREEDPPHHLPPLFAELGLFALAAPPAHGGVGPDWTTLTLIAERLGRHAFMAAALFNRVVCFGMSTLLAHGDEAQKAELLPALMQGQALISLALTEPQAGSDAGAVMTRAERTAAGWRITGRKTWISGAESARLMVVAARTQAGSAGARGVSLFLVPPAAPGVSMTRLGKLGNRCSLSWDIGLDGVEVPAAALIGREGEGFRALMTTLNSARAGLAAAVVGVAQSAMELMIAHARERRQFGRPIGDFQAIAHRIADLQTQVDLARLLVRDLAAKLDAGADCRREAAQAKLTATETLKRVTAAGMQIMASAAYADDSDMQRHFRDAQLYTFGEGSSEILRGVIAGALGLKGDGR